MEEAILELLWQSRVSGVGDLKVAGSVEQEILRLEVVVLNPVAVVEAERKNELLEELGEPHRCQRN